MNPRIMKLGRAISLLGGASAVAGAAAYYKLRFEAGISSMDQLVERIAISAAKDSGFVIKVGSTVSNASLGIPPKLTVCYSDVKSPNPSDLNLHQEWFARADEITLKNADVNVLPVIRILTGHPQPSRTAIEERPESTCPLVVPRLEVDGLELNLERCKMSRKFNYNHIIGSLESKETEIETEQHDSAESKPMSGSTQNGDHHDKDYSQKGQVEVAMNEDSGPLPPDVVIHELVIRNLHARINLAPETGKHLSSLATVSVIIPKITYRNIGLSTHRDKSSVRTILKAVVFSVLRTVSNLVPVPIAAEMFRDMSITLKSEIERLGGRQPEQEAAIETPTVIGRTKDGTLALFHGAAQTVQIATQEAAGLVTSAASKTKESVLAFLDAAKRINEDNGERISKRVVLREGLQSFHRAIQKRTALVLSTIDDISQGLSLSTGKQKGQKKSTKNRKKKKRDLRVLGMMAIAILAQFSALMYNLR